MHLSTCLHCCTLLTVQGLSFLVSGLLQKPSLTTPDQMPQSTRVCGIKQLLFFFFKLIYLQKEGARVGGGAGRIPSSLPVRAEPNAGLHAIPPIMRS